MKPKLRKNEKALRAVQPNAGIEAAYRKALRSMVEEMTRSTLRALRAAYRRNPPEMAGDELPAATMRRAMRELAKRWRANFDETAPALAAYFAKSASRRNDATLRRILKKGGLAIEFKMTRAQRDILGATIEENVGLIRTIPEQYLSRVQGAAMRSIQTGRDLAGLQAEIMKLGHSTLMRASLIALDQNNKATSAMMRARQMEAGIDEGIWNHSHAGKEPRPTHVAMHGKRYPLAQGMWDEDEGRYVHPGELIRCRCTSRPVVRGFS